MKVRLIIALLSLSILVACSDGSDSPAVAPQPELGTLVALASGEVNGQDSTRAVTWEWLGIPYAGPPVDALRWKTPQAPAPFEDVFQANALPPECPQIDFFGSFVGEEDCLYLNVWRPQSQQRDLPVFFWIHGGGNSSGATNWPLYNGAKLAEQANAVVVTVQYRLGPLGWLFYPPLHDGDPETDSGNFGTLDLIAGLRWVQDNIHQFGGDPGNVTAAGESAGGANILSLMLSQQASGLFHKAIVQSAGGRVTDTGEAELAVGQLLDKLLADEGVPDYLPSPAELFDYLHARSAMDIVLADPGLPAIFGDGHVLPAEGFELFTSGEFPNKVPLLIGTNRDEFKLYTNPLGYNLLPNASPELRDVVGRYVSDLWRVTGADDIATRLDAVEDFPDVYVYRFNWGSPDAQGNSPLPGNFGATGGAIHGGELPFMFGNWDTFLVDEYSELFFTEDNAASRETMSRVMVEYWANFMHRGDPNGEGEVRWLPFSSSEGAFKAVVLDVDYDTDLPAIGEDFDVWTVTDVWNDALANVAPPLLYDLRDYLLQWLGDDAGDELEIPQPEADSLNNVR